MTTSAAGRFGAAGMGTDVVRVFSRALELVNSSAGDSDGELLDMVKRAKREMDKESLHLPKKARSSRVAAAPAEAAELQSLGHSNKSSSAAAAAQAAATVVAAAAAPEHTTSPPAGGSSWNEGGSGATSAAAASSASAAAGTGGGGSSSTAGGGSMTHAQARLMNVIRGGPGRGRIEKPKRKVAR